MCCLVFLFGPRFHTVHSFFSVHWASLSLARPQHDSQERSTRPVYRIDAEEAAAKEASQVSSSQYSTVPSSASRGATKPAALASLFEAPSSSAAASSGSASTFADTAASSSAADADALSASARDASSSFSSSSSSSSSPSCALVADLIAADTSVDAVRAAIDAELAHEREGVFAAFHRDYEYRGPSELLVGRREAGTPLGRRGDALSEKHPQNTICHIAVTKSFSS